MNGRHHVVFLLLIVLRVSGSPSHVEVPHRGILGSLVIELRHRYRIMTKRPESRSVSKKKLLDTESGVYKKMFEGSTSGGSKSARRERRGGNITSRGVSCCGVVL